MRAIPRAAGLVAIALAPAITPVTPASASDAGWEFCAQVYFKGAAEPSCNYRTLAQCQAAISGLGGSCFENPYPRSASKPLAKSAKRQ